ncbi:murein biosynthesis integral membrane protein MurJ [Rhodococcus sp. NPDC003318]|uniref:murein biosynthesis integral membrane protein MurJ n=1 Tax=Rhodococcus sp. NPDC003318 TaxID=3364503 RepID=UPI0036AD80EF
MTGSTRRPPGNDPELAQPLVGTDPASGPRPDRPQHRQSPAAPWERPAAAPGPVPPRPQQPPQRPYPPQPHPRQTPVYPPQPYPRQAPAYPPQPQEPRYLPPQPDPRVAARQSAPTAALQSARTPATPTQGRQAPPPAPEHDDEPSYEPDNSNRRLIASTGSIAIATLVSRITGFLKQVLLLTSLGAAAASSFTVASTMPNMISELVLGAVLTAIVVPVLVRAEKEDDDHGAAFVRRLFTLSVATLGTVSVAAVLAAPLLTRLFLPQDGKVDDQLATNFAYLLLPAILFYGLSALLTAVLNTRQVFRPGAWAPVLNNLTVLVVLGLYWLLPGGDQVTTTRLFVLGVGFTLGVVVQVVTLLPAIRRQGISLKPLWGIDNRLRTFAGMGVAIVLYVLISQIGLMIGTRIAANVDSAGPVIYQQAWLLLQLPYGILGVTVLTAIMPRLSRNAADENTPAVVDDLSVATRLTMVSLVPVVGFLTFAGPQVGQALFGYGNFGAADAERLGHAVSWSAFTLIPYALVLIHLRVFYAREQAWTPTWIILGITGVKVGLSMLAPVVASDDQQVVSLLGVANGLGFTAGAVIGGVLLHRSLGSLRMVNVGKTAVLVVVASVAGGIAMLTIERLLGLDELGDRFGGPGAFVQVGICAVIMLGVTFTLLRIAGIPEVVAGTVAVSRLARRVLGRAPKQRVAAPADTVSIYEAETELLPVIGRVPVERGDGGQLPYPGPRRAGAPISDDSNELHEGARVSDEDVAGGQAGNSTVEASAPAPRAPESSSSHPAERAPQSRPGDRDDAKRAADRPVRRERDLTVDTGVIPIGSPQLPPLRVGEGNGGAPRRAPRGPKLIAGASVAGGRYRLLAPHGGARGLKFWQAHDTKLDREVALTFVDAEQRAGADSSATEGPQAVLSRTLRLGRINSPGLARVLDVVRGSSGGIVVAEWTPGRSLREMADTNPSPVGAARAIRALASAAEAAHRGGGALSIDHPDRVRISADGDAVLAFPATLADADASSDVRGLGAMLYALITARWPLGEPAPAPESGSAPPAPDDRPVNSVGGMKLADRTSDGAPIEPRVVRPEVPFEISAVAVRALEQGGGIRTAATVQHILDQASVVDQKTDMMPALRLGQRPAGVGGPGLPDEADPESQRARSNRMLIALTTLGVLTVIVLALAGWWLANLFAGSNSDQPLTEQNIGLTTAASEPASASATAPAVAPTPVTPAGATVFSPQGSADNPTTARLAVDGDPKTEWSTDAYFEQFPSFKNGVGLLVTLTDPARLSEVSITSPSPGTVVEIRSAPSDRPTLDQTQVIGRATLVDGVTDIPVTADGSTSRVLVWITKLGTDSGQNQTSIAEVGFTAG